MMLKALTLASLLAGGASASIATVNSSARRLQDQCADLDGSGLVDVSDLLQLLAAYGTSADGDTGGDGVTDVVDLLSLLAAFGTSSCDPNGGNAADAFVTCADVSQPDVTPTQCYDNVGADVPLWMDRSYAWIDGPSDVLAGGWTYFRVSLEPQAGAPCSDPANPNNNGREGGFAGNIAKPATVAICCANHCGSVNTPIDQDVTTADPQSTLTWIVHPGTFAITGHGGEPCTFYETAVPAGDYTFCCSTCWGSGLFLSSPDVVLELGNACDSLNANDYSSWSAMANDGWTHDTSGDAHLSDMTHAGVANVCQEGSNWFGWSHNAEVGRLSYVMPAAGTGTVDFGNCWGDPGNVVLYVDDVEVARAGPNEQHVLATIVFQAGSTLAIQDEGQNSVAKLSSITLDCTGDSPVCSPATTITVMGSTDTEMDSNGVCCCCGQPSWFELAELKLFDADGNNIAPSASAVDLLLTPSNPENVAVITDGEIFDWNADRFVVWQNSHNFHGQALVRLTFDTEVTIVGAELYSTNYESFGTNAQVLAGSRSVPTRFVYSAHNNQGAAHAACYMNGQEFPTPCSTQDGAESVGSSVNCGMSDLVVDGYAHISMLQQDWYLVRRDHSVDGGWHPVNDDLTGTAGMYGGFSSDPLADSTWSVPFSDVPFTEYLLASGDMSMWVTITRDELSSRCGSCANCQMTLTGSSNMDSPRQYCRAGSGEDPWISAGDHPDLIVYGEMSWSNHHLGQDGSEDALHRGGSNVWINALPPATTWCNSVTVTGAGDPSWNGVYYRQIDEEHPADGIAFMMDTTHEIYKWGGAWRFADYGVRTYYVANDAGPFDNAVPPSAPAQWDVTAGTAPAPTLSYNCNDYTSWSSGR